MTELIVVLLICVAWAITSIIIKLIERRCKHEWEIVQELPVHGENSDIPIAYLYVLRCKKCGDITQRQVKYRAEGYNLP